MRVLCDWNGFRCEYIERTTCRVHVCAHWYTLTIARLNKIDITICWHTYIYICSSAECIVKMPGRDELYWPESWETISYCLASNVRSRCVRLCYFFSFRFFLLALLYFHFVRYPRQINTNMYQMKILFTCAVAVLFCAVLRSHMPFQIKIKQQKRIHEKIFPKRFSFGWHYIDWAGEPERGNLFSTRHPKRTPTHTHTHRTNTPEVEEDGDNSGTVVGGGGERLVWK